MHSQHAPGDGMGVWIFTFPQVYSPILFLLILSEVWICFFISSECVRDLGSWHQNCKVNQEFVCSSSMDLLYFLSAVGSSWVHFGTGLCIFFFHFWMLAYESKILILHIVYCGSCLSLQFKICSSHRAKKYDFVFAESTTSLYILNLVSWKNIWKEFRDLIMSWYSAKLIFFLIFNHLTHVITFIDKLYYRVMVHNW